MQCTGSSSAMVCLLDNSVRVNFSRGRRVLVRLLWIVALASLPLELWAAPVPVRFKEGTLHGFLVVRSEDGKTLATGESMETVSGDRVTCETVLHFNDGSIHEETTVYSQRRELRLLTYHLRQQGSSFPKPVDAYLNVAAATLTMRTEDHGQAKNETHRLRLPEDVANGMIFNLLKNISPSGETIVSLVTMSPKPRVVKLKIHSAGEQAFSASGHSFKTINYLIHIDLGALTGAIASAIGKQPPDMHVWVMGGKAPTFVKFSGEFFEGGPIWSTQLAGVE